MNVNTRKINSQSHYLFPYIVIAFVLAIIAVGSTLAQSSAGRNDAFTGSQQKPRHAVSGASVDPVKSPPVGPSLLIDSFKVGPFSTHTAAASGTNIKNPQTN